MKYLILAATLTGLSSTEPIYISVPEQITEWYNPYTGALVKQVYCDRSLKAPLNKAFQCLINNNWQHHLKSYNGCYVYRNIAGTNRLSNHAYGRALDINAYMDQPPEVVTCFKEAGFKWGGDWKEKYDPMHFEYLGE